MQSSDPFATGSSRGAFLFHQQRFIPGGGGNNRFKHILLNDVTSGGIAARELRLLEFINVITDMKDWHKKVLDARVVAEWRDDVLHDPSEFTPRMFDFAMQELKYKASKFEKTGMVAVLDCDSTIVKSDTAISPDLRKALCEAVRPLETVPPSEQDWYPGSKKQVLHLVHPSLFPVVYGQTKALWGARVPLKGCEEYICQGAIMGSKQIFSDPYQWLPSQIDIQEDKSVKIASYINNLHPTAHGDLYEVLEQILARTLPLWDECLSDFPNRRRIKVRETRKRQALFSRPTNERDSDLMDIDNDDEIEAKDQWDKEHGYSLHEDVEGDYAPYDILRENSVNIWGGLQEPRNMLLERVDLAKEYQATGLQVIFKLVTIRLNTTRPKYKGGTWHIEGTRSERICASAIYYYDQENISDSSLDFSQMINDDEEEELGQILTRENRLLVFPNTLKHRVGPFSLVDRDRPGHRKILAMCLVDPSQKIPSTVNVPPQQREWWADSIQRMAPFSRLPYEIFDRIVKLAGGYPIGMSKAKEIRLDLMKSRRGIPQKTVQIPSQNPFLPQRTRRPQNCVLID